ncbi:MAG: insulinase family protein [Desulfobacteraceae bacterium]
MKWVLDRADNTHRQIWDRICFAFSVCIVSVMVLSCQHSGPRLQTMPSKMGLSKWPHHGSDLAPDEALDFGRLDNGLRYVIRKNNTPRDRVSMHLYVQVGSRFERDSERGIAHFLEHMLFNGTKNFPPGEMVKFFQRIGMQFGPDANAHTGFEETVFDILLPDGGQKSLSEGLLVLRDYADGALLLPDEVEKEKKVILAEMRSRDSARFRTMKASFRFEMPGLIISDRFPIGEKHTINSIDHRMLRDFYETWYRPERMFLVLVGNLDNRIAKQAIEKRFADMQARQPARPLPEMGQMTHKGVKTFYHYEKDAGATSVAIETIEQRSEPEDSRNYQRHQMLLELSNDMMQKRLDGLVRKEADVLTSAGIGGSYYLKQIKYAEISGHTDPKNWPKALASIEQALRKAIRFGFTTAELDRAKDEYIAQLSKSKREERTRDSKTLSRQIMAGIRDWSVLQSPSQRAALLKPMAKSATLEQVNRTFRNWWSADHRLVLVTGSVRLDTRSASPEKKIQEIYLASSKAAVQRPVDKQLAAFPYLPVPTSGGAIKKEAVLADLGITSVLFDNGLHLFIKPTPFKKDEVLASLSFGNGQSSEPKDQPGLAELTEAVINESGFGALDRTTLEEVLAGRLARIELEIRQDRFVLKGNAATKELPLLFQLMQAFVKDPGFRQGARHLALNRFQQEYERLSKSVDGVMRLKGQNFLAGGDYRFGMPALAQLRKRTLAQAKAWIEPQLFNGPMEVALVGDFEIDRVIELAARYLGTLPERTGSVRALPVPGPKFPEGQTWSQPVQTETPKALVVVAYPTEDFWNIQRTRRLSILAELYNEKLRQRIRENLGAAYSPYAYNRSFRAYKGYGLTQIFVQVDPRLASTIVKEVRHIAEQLKKTVPDPDEFRRVLDPTLTYIKDLRQKNSYWLDSVLTGAARHPEQFDWARSFEADYASIKIEEIAALARKYMNNDRSATIILTPQENGSTTQSP